MASYYYLIASLPLLLPDTPAPLGYDTFLEQCESVVSPSTYEALKTLSVGSCGDPLLKEWSLFYDTLRAELSYQRSIARGRQGEVPGDRSLAAAVQTALSAPNPLEAEQMLLRLEFERLDAMLGVHDFDESALFGYAVKLRLLERQQSFRFETGKEEFLSLLGGIEQKIYS